MQVSVIVTPSLTKAAIARRSKSSIAAVCPSMLAFVKSVPRGAVMVGTGRDRLEPAPPCLAEAFGVGHDVGLRHRHEIRRAEELADLDLMPQGLLADGALLAGKDLLLLVGEPHNR